MYSFKESKRRIEADINFRANAAILKMELRVLAFRIKNTPITSFIDSSGVLNRVKPFISVGQAVGAGSASFNDSAILSKGETIVNSEHRRTIGNSCNSDIDRVVRSFVAHSIPSDDLMVIKDVRYGKNHALLKAIQDYKMKTYRNSPSVLLSQLNSDQRAGALIKIANNNDIMVDTLLGAIDQGYNPDLDYFIFVVSDKSVAIQSKRP